MINFISIYSLSRAVNKAQLLHVSGIYVDSRVVRLLRVLGEQDQEVFHKD